MAPDGLVKAICFFRSDRPVIFSSRRGASTLATLLRSPLRFRRDANSRQYSSVFSIPLFAIVFLAMADRCFASFIGLGHASNYVLFDVSNSQWAMNNSAINDPMAAGPGITYNWSGGGRSYGPRISRFPAVKSPALAA
jgi:hypothetical protein